MPANRTAALGAAAAAVATALITVLGAIDTLEQAIVVCVALLAIGAVAIVFLIGSQRSEKLTATWPRMPDTAPPAAAALVDDPDVDDIPVDELPSDDEEFAAPPPALHDAPGSTLVDPPQRHAP